MADPEVQSDNSSKHSEDILSACKSTLGPDVGVDIPIDVRLTSKPFMLFTIHDSLHGLIGGAVEASSQSSTPVEVTEVIGVTSRREIQKAFPALMESLSSNISRCFANCSRETLELLKKQVTERSASLAPDTLDPDDAKYLYYGELQLVYPMAAPYSELVTLGKASVWNYCVQFAPRENTTTIWSGYDARNLPGFIGDTEREVTESLNRCMSEVFAWTTYPQIVMPSERQPLGADRPRLVAGPKLRTWGTIWSKPWEDLLDPKEAAKRMHARSRPMSIPVDYEDFQFAKTAASSEA